MSRDAVYHFFLSAFRLTNGGTVDCIFKSRIMLTAKEFIMHNLIAFFRNFFHRENGQTLSEYALILVLIAVVAIIAVTLLGNQITAVLNQIANAL
jgi:Flp pilus assembly pilin Flp